jgi:hypothetical protein
MLNPCFLGGDGYLKPSGSSAGSEAAIAGYECIDFAIGSGMNTKSSFHRRQY